MEDYSLNEKLNEKLKQIQMKQYCIMCELLPALEKENISYFLAYGTFLGTIRHQGFIPWDDDVDIQLLWKEYRKFIKYCKKNLDLEKYYFDNSLDRHCYWIFSKIRLKKTYIPTRSNEVNSEIIDGSEGIWIDFFGVINASTNELLCKIQVSLLRLLQTLKSLLLSEKQRGLKKPLVVVINILNHLVGLFLMNVVVMLGGRKSKECINVGSSFGGKASIAALRKQGVILPRYLFNKRRLYEFRKKEFWGVEDYDTYLISCYGKNYMTPKRFNTHITDYSKVIIDQNLDRKLQ